MSDTAFAKELREQARVSTDPTVSAILVKVADAVDKVQLTELVGPQGPAGEQGPVGTIQLHSAS
jgi:hypothetical protein